MTDERLRSSKLDVWLDLYTKLHFLTLRIHNAQGAPDPADSNYIYRRYVHDLLLWFAKQAENMGVIYVRRHASCGHPLHDEDKYLIENDFSLVIDYHADIGEGREYDWLAMNMGQSNEWGACACGNKDEYKKHTVITGILRRKDADHQVMDQLALILEGLHDAVELATESRPRSAIREKLLRVLLRVIDLILPVTMDDFVAHLKASKAQLSPNGD